MNNGKILAILLLFIGFWCTIISIQGWILYHDDNHGPYIKWIPFMMTFLGPSFLGSGFLCLWLSEPEKPKILKGLSEDEFL